MFLQGVGSSQLQATDTQINHEDSRCVKIALLKYKCWIISTLAIACLIMAVFLILDETEKVKLWSLIRNELNITNV